MAEKKRLFLAANLGVATTRRIAEAAAKMRAAAERKGLRVGWVPPANLHVTLKFLGWSPGDIVEAVRDRVHAAVAGRSAFEVGARGVGGFPTDTSARVLWVGVADPSGALAEIARALEAAMAELGFAREDRAFHAHVTLGRVKEGRGTDDVLAPWRKSDFGTSVVREIVLYESHMKSSGSEYIAQFRVPLRTTERQTRVVEPAKESEEPDGGHEPA
jgi:2'-5' RNA ligase